MVSNRRIVSQIKQRNWVSRFVNGVYISGSLLFLKWLAPLRPRNCPHIRPLTSPFHLLPWNWFYFTSHPIFHEPRGGIYLETSSRVLEREKERQRGRERLGSSSLEDGYVLPVLVKALLSLLAMLNLPLTLPQVCEKKLTTRFSYTAELLFSDFSGNIRSKVSLPSSIIIFFTVLKSRY